MHWDFWMARSWVDCSLMWCFGIPVFVVRRWCDGVLMGVLFNPSPGLECVPGKRMSSMANDFVADLMKRKKAEAASDYAASDGELSAWVPTVLELLTRKLRDEKKVIPPASIAVWAKDGAWHASLNHRGLGLRWSAEASTFKGCLEALERALTTKEGETVTKNGQTRAARG